MTVKNTGVKAIGFGSTIILPDETKPLPAGFTETHPVVEFYIKKGFLSAVTASEPEEKTESDNDGTKLEETIKNLMAMTLPELQAEAKEAGIEYTDRDTKKILAQKIAEKYPEE